MPRKKAEGEDLGQGSSVCVAMAIAFPVTRKGGGEVKGQWLRRMVQLSPARPRHLAAAKSRGLREQEGGGGGAGGDVSLHSERRKENMSE